MERYIFSNFIKILFIRLFYLAFVCVVLFRLITLNYSVYDLQILFFVGFFSFAVLLSFGFINLINNFVKRKQMGHEYGRELAIKRLLGEKFLSKQAFSYAKSLDEDLNNIVHDISVAAKLPRMPEVYIVNAFIPNAFSCGTNSSNACIFVTQGLLRLLNYDEIVAVVAHEAFHIKHLDVNFFYTSSLFVSAYMSFARGLFRHVFVERKDEDNFITDYLFATLLIKKQSLSFFGIFFSFFTLVIPLIMGIFYFFLPPKRDFLADAFAARLTGSPKALANALQKIRKFSNDVSTNHEFCNKLLVETGEMTMFLNDDILMNKDPLLNSAFIVPCMKKLEGKGILSTHPSLNERVKVLSSMETPGYPSYNKAYTNATGVKKSLIKV